MQDPKAFLQLMIMLIFNLFFWLPIIIANYFIAVKKTQKPVKYLLLSFIPVVTFAILFYLISLPDLEMKNKLDEIYSELKNKPA